MRSLQRRVADQRVHRPVPLPGGVRGALPVVLAGHVAVLVGGPAAEGADPAGGALAALVVDVQEQHLRALGRQPVGGRRAYPGGGTGHQDRTSGEA